MKVIRSRTFELRLHFARACVKTSYAYGHYYNIDLWRGTHIM